jgi:hypothetical protein
MGIFSNEEGWAYPTLTARKAHYFRGGRSLCRRYGLLAGVPVDPPSMSANESGVTVANAFGPDDCAACSTKLASEVK